MTGCARALDVGTVLRFPFFDFPLLVLCLRGQRFSSQTICYSILKLSSVLTAFADVPSLPWKSMDRFRESLICKTIGLFPTEMKNQLLGTVSARFVIRRA